MKIKAILDSFYYKNKKKSLFIVVNAIVLLLLTIILYVISANISNPAPFSIGMILVIYSFYSIGKEGGLVYGLIYSLMCVLMIFLNQTSTRVSYIIIFVFVGALLFHLSRFIKIIDEKESNNELVKMGIDTYSVSSDEKIKKIVSAIESKKSKIENYRMLTKVAEELLSTLDNKHIVSVISVYLPKLIGKEKVSCMLLVKHEETDSFVQVYDKADDVLQGKSANITYKKDPFDEWVIKNKYTLFVKDVDEDIRFRNLRKDWIQFKSLISIPLFENTRLIGLLKFTSKDAEVFDNEDVRLLNYLGNISASVVENSILYKKTEALATQDGLTGLFIRRYFIERLDEEIKRSKQTDLPFSYIMIDIDFFKKCNDTHGHLFGDKVLRSLGAFLKEDLRDVDVAGRYGGEEFAIILPNTNANGAKFVAERLRENFSKLVITVNDNEGMKLTLSIGGVEFKKNMKVMDVINKADKALYYSKENGRNKVSFWEDITDEV